MENELTWETLTTLLERPIAFHRPFAKAAGGICAGLFLSQAYYWSKRTSNPDGWFYKTSVEWEEETGLTIYEQEGARKKLRAAGLIEEKRDGMPCKLYFRIDRNALLKALVSGSACIGKLPKQESGKSHNKSGQFPKTGVGKSPEQELANCQILLTESTTETTAESTTEITTKKEEDPPTPKKASTPALKQSKTPSTTVENKALDLFQETLTTPKAAEPAPNTAAHILWCIEQESGCRLSKQAASREAAACAEMLRNGHAEEVILSIYRAQNADPKRRTAYTLHYLKDEIHVLASRPKQPAPAVGLQARGQEMISAMRPEFRALLTRTDYQSA